MAPESSSPGVFVEEVSTRRRSIEGVPVGVAAFVGTASTGPIGSAEVVTSQTDFESTFGGLEPDATLAPALRDYFLNGGRRAWVVRVEAVTRVSVEAALGTLGAEEGWDVVCVPSARGSTDPVSAIARSEVWITAANFCEQQKRFLIVDAPTEWIDSQSALAGRPSLGHSRNAAVYFPWLIVDDATAGDQQHRHPPCGAVAAVFARTDAARGIWKAPAGTAATLMGLSRLEVDLSDGEIPSLNEQGVNVLRELPNLGPVVWGARTLATGDPEWKYVNVRRTAIYLERSIERGTQWSVFEPNGEPLWATLRTTVEEFLERLFRQGAFQGESARDAFFVHCGRDTTPQAEIDAGRLRLEVGFAPLKPAEFVVLSFVLMTAEAPSGGPPRPTRRRGTLALFTGPSGSGQFRAATRLAVEQGQELHRVEPTQVLGKFIGETEKNLDRLFKTARKRNWVLFFDEADALFGKRSEVKDSHDRFANVEVSYLLKKIKRSGVTAVIATTSVAKTPKKLRRKCKYCLEFPLED